MNNNCYYFGNPPFWIKSTFMQFVLIRLSFSLHPLLIWRFCTVLHFMFAQKKMIFFPQKLYTIDLLHEIHQHNNFSGFFSRRQVKKYNRENVLPVFEKRNKKTLIKKKRRFSCLDFVKSQCSFKVITWERKKIACLSF